MARRRKEQPVAVVERLQALIDAGRTAEAIAATLKAEGIKGVSRATIGRRMLESRGKTRAGRVSKGPTVKKAVPPPPPPSAKELEPEPEAEFEVPLPSDPSAIPEGLSLEMLHKMLQQADRAATTALERRTKEGEPVPDLATFGAMGRLVTSVSEAIRKATPAPKVDPAESPDMVAAAKSAREKLHRLVNLTIGAVNG